MDLPFYNKEIKIIDGLGFKYYEGEITDRHKTEGGNLLITIATPSLVRERYGVVSKVKVDHPSMNFLVPKRREFLWNKLNEVPLKTKILVQLQPEARSGKFCVSEFHISR